MGAEDDKLLEIAAELAPDTLRQEADSLHEGLLPKAALIASAVNVGFALIVGAGGAYLFGGNPVSFAIPAIIGLTSADVWRAWKHSSRLEQIQKYDTHQTL